METLVMPMNYVELQEDEMMYLDGGWDAKKIVPNAMKLAAAAGGTWIFTQIANFARANTHLGFWSMVSKMGGTAAKVLWALPWWAKLLGFAAGAAVIWALGEYDF